MITELNTATGPGLSKVPSGVSGLDEILRGGLPRGRPTLVCCGAGCGKTLLAMEFLCRGAVDHGEPGVFIAFEETPEELAANVASLGFDLVKLQEGGLLAIDHVHLDPAEIVETGEYDLEALFLRIAGAVAQVGAKRIAIDTIEVLFGTLTDGAVVRSELKRLFGWLKEHQLTSVITAEHGDGERISRYGIEEYVSDCVLVLDHRVVDEMSTRRLRVLKYRGSLHGTNEYPFLISSDGIVVLPLSSLGLTYGAPTERVSTGIARLDEVLSGGPYRGSSVLISGSAGTGKTIFAAHFAVAACSRGERVLYISREESPAQLARNTASVGLNLGTYVESGLLRVESMRPTVYGLEQHLAWLHDALGDFRPDVVILDPVTSVAAAGTSNQVTSMLMREVDMMKARGITGFFTALTHRGSLEEIDVQISSLIDTWLLAETIEVNGERNRALFTIKSRGMAHSNQLLEFTISQAGIELLQPYVGPAGVLTGSARLGQEEEDRLEDERRVTELARRQNEYSRRQAVVEAKVDELRAELESEHEQLGIARAALTTEISEVADQRAVLATHRWATARNGRRR